MGTSHMTCILRSASFHALANSPIRFVVEIPYARCTGKTITNIHYTIPSLVIERKPSTVAQKDHRYDTINEATDEAGIE